MLKPRLFLGLAAACCVVLTLLTSRAQSQTPPPQFLEPTVQTGPATCLLVHDLDGDGRQDVAAGNGPSAKVTVLLSQGNGRFAKAPDVVTGKHVTSLAAADFDGDGDADLAVGLIDNRGVLIASGNGDGSFTPDALLLVVYPAGLATGDFDEDGDVDLVAGSWSSDKVTLLRNSGGSFSVLPPVSTPAGPVAVRAADFDGDGHLDVATANDAASVSLLTGDGAGGLSSPVSYALPQEPTAMAVGDIDEDGRPDVLATYWGAVDNCKVFLGQREGLTAGAPATLGYNPMDLSLADLDEDGHLDLIAANFSFFPVTVLSGDGDGGFGAESTLGFDEAADLIATGQFNGDVDVDLQVFAGFYQRVHTVLGQGDGTFALNEYLDMLYQVQGAGDFDEDGDADLVTTGDSQVVLQLAHGAAFVAQPSVPAGSNLAGALTDDFDADGHLDLAVSSGGAGLVTILLGAGDASLANAGAFPMPPGCELLAGGDFDGDGQRDLAAANDDPSGAGPPVVTTLRGLGDGSFQPGVSTGGLLSPARSLAVADFDGNGRDDVAVPDELSNSVKIFAGQPSGAVALQWTLATGGAPQGAVAGDFDGDGQADLAVARSTTNTIAIYLGNGTGGFGAASSYAAGLAPRSLVAADFDGDELGDLLCTNLLSGTVGLMRGHGDGSFAAMEQYRVGAYPWQCWPADFDGDARLDVLATQEAAGRYLLRNQGGSASFAWTNLGQPLAGANGPPLLFGQGTLAPASSGKLALEHGAPLAPLMLFVALASNPTPFKGGVLVPVPASLMFGAATSPGGNLTLPWAAWPAGLPSVSLYFQCAIQDAAAVAGVALSNAVRAELP